MGDAMLSSDYSTIGYTVFVLLFFVPYCREYGYSLIAFGIVPLCCVLPFAIMPLFYSMIHRADTLLFGRYHIIMPLSGFLSALSFVFMFGGGTALYSTVCAFVFAPIFCLSGLLYRYCMFSVRARLIGDNVGRLKTESIIWGVAGALIAVGGFIGFYFYNAQTAYINTAYLLAMVGTLTALGTYLTSFYQIPQLGGKRIQSVKSVFRTFYKGINKRTYFSSLFFLAAFATLAALFLDYAVVLFAADMVMPIICAAVLIAVFAIACKFCNTHVKLRRKAISVTALLCCLASATAIIAVWATNLIIMPMFPVLLLCGVFAAAGGALCSRQMRLRFLTVKANVTSGAVFALSGITRCAAIGIAVAVALAVSVMRQYSVPYELAYGAGLAVVFALVAFVLARKKSFKYDQLPELSYELSDDGDVKSANAETVPDGKIQSEQTVNDNAQAAKQESVAVDNGDKKDVKENADDKHVLPENASGGERKKPRLRSQSGNNGSANENRY